jgi:hypothetical protein
MSSEQDHIPIIPVCSRSAGNDLQSPVPDPRRGTGDWNVPPGRDHPRDVCSLPGGTGTDQDRAQGTSGGGNTGMRTTCLTALRSFDHSPLAALPAYPLLRQALSDVANQAAAAGRPVDLGMFLRAARDMAATAPYADCCEECDGARIWWPHKVVCEGGWITGTYRCDSGHIWECGYSIAGVMLLGGNGAAQ